MKKFFGILLLSALLTSAFAAEPKVALQKGPVETLLSVKLDYKSRFTAADINDLLDPKNDHLPDLFKDPMRLSGGPRKFGVVTSTGAMGVKIQIEAEMVYSRTNSGTSTIHTYNFSNFSRLFNSSIIRIVVNQSGSNTSVSIAQNASMRTSGFKKISDIPFGENTFKSKVGANIKNFQKNSGGI